jgi:HEAT repeat protein
MVRERPIFRLLLREENSAVDQALLFALAHCEASEVEHIVSVLLSRQRPAALQGILAHLHRYPENTRDVLARQGERVFPGLREAAQSRDEQVRLNVVEMIRRGRLYRAAYLLDAALHDRAQVVRTAAADALRRLAAELLAAAPTPPDPATLTPEQIRTWMGTLEAHREDREQIASAIGSALTCFGLHGQTGIVEAAMWLADELDGTLWAALGNATTKLARLALSILENSSDPRMVPFALAGLQHAEFRPIVARTLCTCIDPAFLAEWVGQSWRFHSPKFARGVVVLRDLVCLRDSAKALLQIPEGHERIPHWLLATGVSLETRLTTLRDLHRRGERRIQRATVWALVGLYDERSTILLQKVASGTDAELARIARFELARRMPGQYHPEDLLGKRAIARPQPTTPPAAIPQAASFARLWNEFEHLSEADRLSIGHDVFKNVRDAELLLRRKLTSLDPPDRIRALRIMAAVDLVPVFSEEIYALSHDPQPDVRSAAIATLGQLGDPTCRLILQSALLDPDMRVQANAVEAVERLSETFDPLALLPKLASPDNRVRANAVKALLKLGVREAAETLLRMMQDSNRAQRISALWLIEHMGLFTLASRVLAMANADGDQHVRDRAQRLVGTLTQRAVPAQPAEPAEVVA